jgi:hypothetical protein
MGSLLSGTTHVCCAWEVNMGLPIADNVYLEDAAREAERLKRWEFMLTLQIYQIQGGTASPFNGLATF